MSNTMRAHAPKSVFFLTAAVPHTFLLYSLYYCSACIVPGMMQQQYTARRASHVFHFYTFGICKEAPTGTTISRNSSLYPTPSFASLQGVAARETRHRALGWQLSPHAIMHHDTMMMYSSTVCSVVSLILMIRSRTSNRFMLGVLLTAELQVYKKQLLCEHFTF